MDPRVVQVVLPFFTERFGNPGSVGHVFGEEARADVEKSRLNIATCLNVNSNEIVFTSGATESNNLAIRGIADRYRDTGGHFLSVTTEHKAVLDPLERLRNRGFEVELLEPRPWSDEVPGWIDPQQVSDSIREDTRLVSIMLANNEMGIVLPIKEIAEVCHQKGTLLHCDATQAVGKLPLDVDDLGVDLLSFSGHKIYGPRGVGALVIRRRRPRIRISPLIEGGGQEEGRRSGTLNVPGIVGLALALQLCVDEISSEQPRIQALRHTMFERITQELGGAELNGPEWQHRLPGNLNMRFGDVDGEALMMNMANVAVSSGSACTSANPEPSHVLRAIGLNEDQTRSSLRFGIGRFNTESDIDTAVTTLVAAVHRLRRLSRG